MNMLDEHFYQKDERTGHIYDTNSCALITSHLHIDNAGVQKNDTKNKLVIQEDIM